MDTNQLADMLIPYNPWWQEQTGWYKQLPVFERPVVRDILADLQKLPQIVSLTGPRRVGKSTALHHIIRHLLTDEKVDPRCVTYFSFDDPDLYEPAAQKVVFDLLIARTSVTKGQHYMFLDEIQQLPKWELYLKKYYDLKVPVRFIISGSASSPIFRKSHESLLGRIKDRHLLPFSFREYCQYHLLDVPGFSQMLEQSKGLRAILLDGDNRAAIDLVNRLSGDLKPFSDKLDEAMRNYCREGGFPEVWAISDEIRKVDYLIGQQVRKVLYEDLMTVTRYRKPENVMRFFLHLVAHPGEEINTTAIASEAGVAKQVVEDNLPRLEMTDLILRFRKFSHKPLRLRQGSIKCYPVDLALRNAVMKTWHEPDAMMMGRYAENLVARELSTWSEGVELSYFREKDLEVDFVLTHSGNKYLPIEVKHRQKIRELAGLKHFMRKYHLKSGIVITNDQESHGDEILHLPLRYFLLATQ